MMTQHPIPKNERASLFWEPDPNAKPIRMVAYCKANGQESCWGGMCFLSTTVSITKS